MAFIDKTDYLPFVQNGILDQITEANDPLLDIVEGMTIAEMAGYLNARYDTTALFAQTGANRNPAVLMFAIDITLYHLHSRINPRKVPDHRKERYDRAKEWLTEIQAGNINPPDLPLPTDGTKQYILFGSNTRRNNHV